MSPKKHSKVATVTKLSDTSTVQTVTQTVPKTVAKSLVVTFEDGVPRFKFVGSWVGRDVMNVSRLFTRAYKYNQREVKRVSAGGTK